MRMTLRTAALGIGAVLGIGLIPLVPRLAAARQPHEIEWEDLIPQGVPYGEIAGPGTHDEATTSGSPSSTRTEAAQWRPSTA